MEKIFFIVLFTIIILKFADAQQLHPPFTCTTTVCQQGNSVSSGTTHAQYQQGRPGKRGGVGAKGDKGDPCQCDIVDEKAMESLRNELRNKFKDYDDIIERLELLEEFPENCLMRQKSKSRGEGFERYGFVPIYPFKFIDDVTPRMVNCTKILTEGTDGWITIQKRKDGDTNFYRNWESYARGFGNRQNEFWLGLRNIHKMTTTRSCKLRIDFETFGGATGYAEYSTFRVANEESLFRLTVYGYTGDAHDSMARHNGQAFSTMDRDNDAHSSSHCAQYYKSGWWHKNCLNANLNGKYYKSRSSANDRVSWYDGNIWAQLRFVEMKVLCS